MRDKNEKRVCMYINPSQDPTIYGGYVPSLVTEGEPGHAPMLGKGEGSAPWIWGDTLEKAEATAKHWNKQHGISELEAWKIVASSMSASRIE